MKTGWAVALTVVIMAGLAGGGYYYLNKQNQTQMNDLQSQIDDLNAKLAAEKAASTTATTIADATANWKTYTNSTYSFNFKYPSNFVVTQSDLPGIEFSINPSDKNGDNAYKVNNESTDLFSLSWHQTVESSTLNAFIAKTTSKSKTDTTVGSYQAIKLTSINNSDVDQVVFDANGTIGSFYSHVNLLLDNKVITAAQAATYNTDFNQILASFKSTK